MWCKLKRNIIIVLSFILVITVGVAVYVTQRPSNTNIYYAPAYDDKSLKELGVALITTDINPKINRNEIHEIAENMLKQSSVHPKGIYLEYGLITDNNITINAISKEAIEANPALKSKKSISDIPVWIITFKGLLPEDYKQDTNAKGKQPLDISSTVIDAMTGKVLFGFGSGKQH